MPWLNIVPHFLIAAAIVFAPGAAIAWAGRARGFALAAMAPAITVSVVAVSAILAPMAGVKWSLLPVLALTLLTTLVALVVGKRITRRAPTESTGKIRRADWVTASGHVAAVVIAAVLIGRRLIAALGEPESFSQTFDNVFHLNAIRYIQDTGSGSSLTIGSMTGGGFYPAAWHDFVALVVSTTGASIPVSVNVLNLVVGSVVWPLGCIFLAHKVLGTRVAVSLIAGVLSAAFGAFPMALLDFGVLYPNFLGDALLPTALGLGIQALGLSHQSIQPKTLDWLFLFAVLPGITLAHPSSTMALFALLIPPVLYVCARTAVAVARKDDRRSMLALGGMAMALIVGAVVLVLLWKIVRPPEAAAVWQPVETTGRAIGEVISSSGIGRPAAWAVMVLAVVGLFSAVLARKQLWMVGIYVAGAVLFVIAASFPFGDFRTFVSGVWYNDPPRLAALLPLVTLPLATGGALWLWDNWVLPWVVRGNEIVGRGKGDEAAAGPAQATSAALLRSGPCLVAASVLIGVLVISTQQASVREAQQSMADSYRLTEDSALLSTDEMALIKRLPQEVPEDATMVGNPWNGSSLAYAFANRKLLQLHILSALPDGAAGIINGLNAANADPKVCTAVERLRVQYVLDFGHVEVHGRDNGYRGLDDLVAAGVATLEDSQGEAKLYKIDACGQ